MNQRNINEYNLAKKAGLSNGFFSNLKNGRNLPSLETIYKLSLHFEVPVDFFLIADEPELPEPPPPPPLPPPDLNLLKDQLIQTICVFMKNSQ